MTSETSYTIRFYDTNDTPATRGELAAAAEGIRAELAEFRGIFSQALDSIMEIMRLTGDRLDAQREWMLAHGRRHDLADQDMADIKGHVISLGRKVQTLDAGQIVTGDMLGELKGMIAELGETVEEIADRVTELAEPAEDAEAEAWPLAPAADPSEYWHLAAEAEPWPAEDEAEAEDEAAEDWPGVLASYPRIYVNGRRQVEAAEAAEADSGCPCGICHP